MLHVCKITQFCRFLYTMHHGSHMGYECFLNPPDIIGENLQKQRAENFNERAAKNHCLTHEQGSHCG